MHLFLESAQKRSRKPSKKKYIEDEMSSYSQVSPSIITYLSPAKRSSKRYNPDSNDNNLSYGAFNHFTSVTDETSHEMLVSPNENFNEFLYKIKKKALHHNRVKSFLPKKFKRMRSKRRYRTNFKSSKKRSNKNNESRLNIIANYANANSNDDQFEVVNRYQDLLQLKKYAQRLLYTDYNSTSHQNDSNIREKRLIHSIDHQNNEADSFVNEEYDGYDTNATYKVQAMQNDLVKLLEHFEQ